MSEKIVKGPSARIQEIFLECSRDGHDWPDTNAKWIWSIIQYLDEQAGIEHKEQEV